jgi:hypothetical protein
VRSRNQGLKGVKSADECGFFHGNPYPRNNKSMTVQQKDALRQKGTLSLLVLVVESTD